jgi:integral membrane protein (TIGR01906 family)
VSRLATAVLGIAIALAVPAVLAVNGIRLLTNDEYVRLVYDYGGVPSDRYGLTEEQRRELAGVGLRSILPRTEEGVDLLRRTRLPSGERAFDERELRHMQDVRTLVSRAYRFQLVAAIAIAACALLLGLFRSTRTVVPLALVRGAALTVGVAVVVGLVAALGYDTFSGAFHGLFFEGRSWRFQETDTLRRLYPDRFWLDTAIVLGVLAVLQAVAVFTLGRLWARRAGARQAFRARARTQGS